MLVHEHDDVEHTWRSHREAYIFLFCFDPVELLSSDKWKPLLLLEEDWQNRAITGFQTRCLIETYVHSWKAHMLPTWTIYPLSVWRTKMTLAVFSSQDFFLPFYLKPSPPWGLPSRETHPNPQETLRARYFRPMSLTFIPCKILERTFHSNILNSNYSSHLSRTVLPRVAYVYHHISNWTVAHWLMPPLSTYPRSFGFRSPYSTLGLTFLNWTSHSAWAAYVHKVKCCH